MAAESTHRTRWRDRVVVGWSEVRAAELAHPLHHHSDRHPLDRVGVVADREVQRRGRDERGGQVEPVGSRVCVRVRVWWWRSLALSV
jgi:hypothetical protein